MGDIYGQSPPVDESPAIVTSKIKDLDAEIDLMPSLKKQGYTEAQEKCFDVATDKELKLMFLRCEKFDAKAAANRFMTYWDKRIEIFGIKKAILPLTLDEALKDDHVAMSIGFIQITDIKDPDGRAIVFVDFSTEGTAKYERLSLVRTVWCVLHTALQDIGAQKYGIVFVVKCSGSLRQWDMRASKMLADSLKSCLPLRVGALHVCHPPSHIKIMLKISKIFLGKKLRERVHVHSGSNEDVLEKVSKYGIGTESFPPVWGGEFILNP